MKARRQDLTAAAREVAALAGERAAAADAAGRLDRDVVDALIEAGFARYFVPAAFGGDEGTFAGALEATAVLGEECASTAWIASLMAGVGRMAAYLPEGGRSSVWEKGPDTVVVGALMAAGTATGVSGGYRLSGRWSYVSGSEFADWALVCGRSPAGDDGGPMFFAVPRAEFHVEETWDNAGMRATASHTLVVDDVLVPADHAVPLARLSTGGPGGTGASCYAVPLRTVNGLTLVGPMLGAARGALRAWAVLLHGKLFGGMSGSISGTVDRSHYEAVLARSGGEIDAAALLAQRTAATADAVGGAGLSPLERARAPRDCAVAADLLARAADRLFRTSGSRGQVGDGALQRLWRDVSCAAGHSGLQPAASARAFAEAYLGQIAG